MPLPMQAETVPWPSPIASDSKNNRPYSTIRKKEFAELSKEAHLVGYPSPQAMDHLPPDGLRAAAGAPVAPGPHRVGKSPRGGHPDYWSDAKAHLCKDGRRRRFKPGVFPLADGLPRGMVYSGDPRRAVYANSTQEARVMRLKGYGNAICIETAVLFLQALDW